MRKIMRKPNVFSGQKVITTSGDVVTIAFVNNGQVFAFTQSGIQVVHVVADAWGGEHDQEIGLAA